MKRGQAKPVAAAKKNAVMTDECIDRSAMRSYARMGVLLGISLSALLVLIGASLLFSLVRWTGASALPPASACSWLR